MFRELFENNPRFNGKSYYDKIRAINSLISFAAIQNPIRDPKEKQRIRALNEGHFYSYIVHGQVYTNINTAAIPDSDEPPTNAQLYYVDVDELKQDMTDKSRTDKLLKDY